MKKKRDFGRGRQFFGTRLMSLVLPAVAWIAVIWALVFSACRKDDRPITKEPPLSGGDEEKRTDPGKGRAGEVATQEEQESAFEKRGKTAAGADVDVEKPVDIMDASLIRVSRDLDDAYRRGRKAVYSIKMSNPEARLISTAYQEAVSKGGGRYVLKVLRPDYRTLERTRLPVKADRDLDAYLRPSPTLQSNAPLIMELAQKAARGSSDGLETALRLERFVYDYIEDKDYSVASATALDTARERKGDCTEHAYLFAALARALGLPARVVSGLLFASSFMDIQNVFVYHMWNEVHLGGKWVPFDSTRPDPGVGVTHIALAVDDMNAMIPISGAAVIMKTMGAMSIEALETVSDDPKDP